MYKCLKGTLYILWPSQHLFCTLQGVGEEGVESVGKATPYGDSASPGPASARGASSVALTNKTGGEESTKDKAEVGFVVF